MINSALLIIFTGFSFNLVVQIGLGIRNSMSIKQFQFRYSLFQSLILFFSVLFTWLAFGYVIIPLGLSFLETLLLLPLSFFFAAIVEKGFQAVLSRWINPDYCKVFSAYKALVFASAFFITKVGNSFGESLIMAAGFALGYFLSMAIVMEIHKRSSIEAVPKVLRGAPLLLISLGLLSLVCSAAAVFLLQMIELVPAF
jgi:electron transport complex protein RnfA